jgi:hypothetical protein
MISVGKGLQIPFRVEIGSGFKGMYVASVPIQLTAWKWIENTK